jgi:indole-3-glycerol phosphate synthase
VLEDLVAGALADAEARRSARPLAVVEFDAENRAPARDGLTALAPAEHVKIIAEVKRSSPSRGPFADIPDPAGLARLYERGGASAVSVLTEQRQFRGAIGDLEAVSGAVRIPVLRKDFIADPYQVFEARAAGADMVLLIVAALEHRLLVELYKLVADLGMTALVETHNDEEVARAVDMGSQLIGINARNLSTFELDRNLFSRLSPSVPSQVIKVAESAVKDASDVRRYREAGADVVLVGEALVTGDPLATLAEFVEV